jgi:hypothetical protein
MSQFTNKADVITGGSTGIGLAAGREPMNSLINILIKFGVLKKDHDYYLIRTSMVIIFVFFGYQKWFEYEAQVLIPYISNSPLLFWMYPVFGIDGTTWFLGVRNGCLPRSCSSDSGIKNREFLGLSAQLSLS